MALTALGPKAKSGHVRFPAAAESIADIKCNVLSITMMRDVASTVAMSERGRKRVEEKFSLDAEAAAIAAVYRSLI